MPVNQTSNISFLPQHRSLCGNRESRINNSIKRELPCTTAKPQFPPANQRKAIPNPTAITVCLFSFEGPFDSFLSFHLLRLFKPTLNTLVILRSSLGVCLLLSFAQERTAGNGTKINLRFNFSLPQSCRPWPSANADQDGAESLRAHGWEEPFYSQVLFTEFIPCKTTDRGRSLVSQLSFPKCTKCVRAFPHTRLPAWNSFPT